MSSFTDPLEVRKVIKTTENKFLWFKYPSHKQYWKTLRKFRYYVGEEDGDDFIDVPKGFKTDFASVPRMFWTIFPPDGIWSQAAVLHDYNYTVKKRSRKDCDNIFLESMQVLGVPIITRRLMFRAVRSFGWIPWNHAASK